MSDRGARTGEAAGASAAAGPGATSVAAEGEALHGSKDYWDLVLVQLKRKPSVILAAGGLVFLYAVAIFAPLLANDRPYLLEATDAESYRRAYTSLVPISLNLRGMIGKGEAGHLAQQEVRREQLLAAGQAADDSSLPGWGEALASEGAALRTRLDTMASQLSATDAALLDEMIEAVDATVVAGASNAADAADKAGALVELARRIKDERKAALTGTTPEPGATVTLLPTRQWPLIDSLTRAEIYFMVLWLGVMFLPVWNGAVNRWLLGADRERIRGARRFKAAAMVIVPLLAALLWEARDASFETSPYKERLTSGEITADRVVFAPFAFGFAEVNDGEYFRPPTWHADSEITEEGYYARGARAESLDTVVGFRPPPKPVADRAGEPSRNATIRHPLGTDSLGRDLTARMIWGARVSLSVGLVSTILLVLIGVTLGSMAGFYGGWIDVIISRVIEVVQCFPVFFLILIFVAFTQQTGIVPIMVVIGIFRWTGVARLVRGEFIRLRGQDFVLASQALGVGDFRTIFRHVLPNAMGPVLVAATFAVASGILTESALSFLGFGIQLPIPSWGSIVNESKAAEHWWIQIFPGALIFITVMLYNLLGEGVRDALDPRLKKA